MPLSPARSGSLLYDEDCGLCVATAEWLRGRTDPERLRLLPLGEAAADARIGGLVAGRRLADAIHFVGDDDRVLAGAPAVLAAARLVPRWRRLAALYDHGPGHRLLEPLYRLIAANRRRIGRRLGLAADCRVPANPPAAGR